MIIIYDMIEKMVLKERVVAVSQICTMAGVSISMYRPHLGGKRRRDITNSDDQHIIRTHLIDTFMTFLSPNRVRKMAQGYEDTPPIKKAF